ncbi:MAG TPA: M15 family metallopeptidase [Arachidicoccus sp.]|nr:M15 family metallopeptidase [Arachidicoccus sp.]
MTRHALFGKRHQNLQNIILLTGCLLMGSVFFSALNAQTYKKNKYGLKIIEQINQYQARVAADSSSALVPLKDYIKDLKTAFVYGTTQNFTGQLLYKNPAAYLRLPVAKALQHAADKFRDMGYGLIIYDAYRPYSVTQRMWEVVPDNRYAADPSHGSGHNKGICVDLSLYDLRTGEPLQMPTGFDNFTKKAHQDYMKLPENVLQNRKLLKQGMTASGFKALSTEWWHFSYPDPEGKFELMDLSFHQLEKATAKSGCQAQN